MTSRVSWKLALCALFVSGCQSTGSWMPWQLSGSNTYTAEDVALTDPMPAASRPQLSSEMQPGNGNTSSIRTVSASATSTPVAAGRIDQLIKSGQSAIREAGQGNPAKLQEASQYFVQVLNVEPGNSSAHHGLAIVADLQKNWRSAEDHYKLALQQRPQDPSLLNDLGYSYVLQNRFHEASNYLTQAIQLSPQHERAHINLALLSLKRGDRSGAEARLASIYSPSEINRTLARLEADLQKTGPPTHLASAQQPRDWNGSNVQSVGPQNQTLGANSGFSPNPAALNAGSMNQNFTQAYPNSQPFATQPFTGQNYPVNNQMLQNNAFQNQQRQQHSSLGTYPQQQPGSVPIQPEEKPISVYPSGMFPESEQPQTNTVTPRLQNGGVTAATYGGGVPPIGVATQTRVGGFSGNNMNGTPVGGVISQPVPGQSVSPNFQIGSPVNSTGVTGQGYPNATGSSQSQAPVQGLNAGPGALFPIQTPVQNGNGILNIQAPAQPAPNQNFRPSSYPPGVMNSAPQQNYGQPGTGQSPISTVSSQRVTQGYPTQGNFGQSVPNGLSMQGTQRMQAYEQQVQQLNGQFHQTMQQFDGTRTAMGGR